VGDDLLGEHVERVAEEAGGLDEAVAHALHDHRGLEQVAAVLGEERPLRSARPPGGRRDRCAAAPEDDRTRRLDLDDEVDRAHVDAELERRWWRRGPQLARLSSSSMTSRCSRASEPWCAFTSSISPGDTGLDALARPPAR
jgi:hypothetical protein